MSLVQAAGEHYTGSRRLASLVALVLVNLIPLIGVLLFDWDVAALMILYWSENLVLGFFTLVKMLMVAPLGGLFSSAFFLIHYGGFCGFHGMFIMLTLVDDEFKVFPEEAWPAFLVFPQILFNVVMAVLAYAPPAWMVAFGALFISHGVSFLVNFVYGPERETASVKELMGAPYGRIVILHVAIIAGGFAVVALGQPLGMLLVLILLKLTVDIALHLRQHRKMSG